MSEIAIILCVIAAILQLFDHFYHLSPDIPSENLIRNNTSYEELRKILRNLAFKPLDNYFCILPYIWSYLYITASILIFHEINNIAIRVILILFITGRMRSLQEISHFAVHGALCGNLKYAMTLANIFYQYPTFMPSAKNRRRIHVMEHHNSINMEHDPDLKELTDKKLQPKISKIAFWIKLFYYVTPNGILSRVKEIYSYYKESSYSEFILRLLIPGLITIIFLYYHYYNELLFLYLMPVLITYPTFYWLAHVALHRWFVECDDDIPYYQRELIIGRPTNFSGFVGYIVRHNLFPVGDSYHLAHSLFPIIRWTHLPKVDKILRKAFKTYAENESHSLFFKKSGKVTVFSELEERLTIG